MRASPGSYFSVTYLTSCTVYTDYKIRKLHEFVTQLNRLPFNDEDLGGLTTYFCVVCLKMPLIRFSTRDTILVFAHMMADGKEAELRLMLKAFSAGLRQSEDRGKTMSLALQGYLDIHKAARAIFESRMRQKHAVFAQHLLDATARDEARKAKGDDQSRRYLSID